MSIIIEPQKQPDLMAALQRLSLAQALHMEVKYGMKLSRGVHALQIAKKLGFTGTRKTAALHWTLALMREHGQDVPRTLQTWEAENPA